MTPEFTLAALRVHLERHAGAVFGVRPAGFALFGSAVLYLHGLRTEIGDVDLVVSPEGFERLLDLGWTVAYGEGGDHPPYLSQRFGGHEVHVFETWRADQPEIDLPLVLDRAEYVAGWPCAPLALVAHHKATTLVRTEARGLPPIPKHVDDLANIVAHMADVESIARTA